MQIDFVKFVKVGDESKGRMDDYSRYQMFTFLTLEIVRVREGVDLLFDFS